MTCSQGWRKHFGNCFSVLAFRTEIGAEEIQERPQNRWAAEIKIFLGIRERLVREAGNITAIYEPTV
jgi:hypothetical protein